MVVEGPECVLLPCVAKRRGGKACRGGQKPRQESESFPVAYASLTIASLYNELGRKARDAHTNKES